MLDFDYDDYLKSGGSFGKVYLNNDNYNGWTQRWIHRDGVISIARKLESVNWSGTEIVLDTKEFSTANGTSFGLVNSENKAAFQKWTIGEKIMCFP